LRTFRVPGLERETGRLVLMVDEKPVYAVDVERGTATLKTAADGPARVAASFESQETLDEIIEGQLHPIVAALQNRFTPANGDRRFGLSVMLALRASAPVFAERKP
jgi:hypothetical protein